MFLPPLDRLGWAVHHMLTSCKRHTGSSQAALEATLLPHVSLLKEFVDNSVNESLQEFMPALCLYNELENLGYVKGSWDVPLDVPILINALEESKLAVTPPMPQAELNTLKGVEGVLCLLNGAWY